MREKPERFNLNEILTPMTSAREVQCSTNSAIKPLTRERVILRIQNKLVEDVDLMRLSTKDTYLQCKKKFVKNSDHCS